MTRPDMETPANTVNAAYCPSCERYIGPAATCPYCDCDARPQPFMRVMRIAAVLLATIGLACLFMAARQRETPVVRIASINPMMNFANVRVSAKVVRTPYIAEKDGEVDYVSFFVSDGSGELLVSASRKVAAALVAGDNLPVKGDRVDVRGTLDVSGDGKIRLRLRSVGQLVVGADSVQ